MFPGVTSQFLLDRVDRPMSWGYSDGAPRSVLPLTQDNYYLNFTNCGTKRLFIAIKFDETGFSSHVLRRTSSAHNNAHNAQPVLLRTSRDCARDPTLWRVVYHFCSTPSGPLGDEGGC